MKEISCIIVDDEILAIRLLQTYIDQTSGIGLKGHFTNPLEALAFLSKEAVDLIFLDIQMPQLKGTDMALRLSPENQVVFVTAYARYAAESYDIDAADYLVKPIRLMRFQQSVDKVRRRMAVLQEKDHLTLTVKSGYDLVRINLEKVEYIESMKEYVAFVTTEKKVLSYMNMQSVMNELPKESFVRIHRSYIVNTRYIQSLKGKTLILKSTSLPVSRSYLKEVKAFLTIK